jgi:hypothetical protein
MELLGPVLLRIRVSSYVGKMAKWNNTHSLLFGKCIAQKAPQPLFKKAVPAVEIVMFNGNREMFETPDSNASEIVSRIQDAMTPF